MNFITHGWPFPAPLFSFLGSRFLGSFREILLVIGALATISLVVLAWGLLTHKPGRHHRRRHDPHRKSSTPAPGATEESPKRKWRRRRREDRRPRNPTLAETGGLPPTRSGPSIDPGL